MLALLLGGGVIYLLIGDTADALILLVFACLSVVVTVVWETRTELVLNSLRDPDDGQPDQQQRAPAVGASCE